MSHALDPPSPCHKLSHLLGPPPPSSVTYFMDGPYGPEFQKNIICPDLIQNLVMSCCHSLHRLLMTQLIKKESSILNLRSQPPQFG